MSGGQAELPPWKKIAAHYREKIASGEIAPGEYLPSQKKIASLWKVSGATAEKALRALRNERLVTGVHGIGTQVLPFSAQLSTGSDRHDRATRTQSSWGDGERSGEHTATIVPAPVDVAEVLDIRASKNVLRRTRIYRDAHGVVAHSTSWIPEEFALLVPELLTPARLKGGLSIDLIGAAIQSPAVQRIDRETARIATAEDLRLLGIGPSTVAAILVLTACFLDASGRTLEYGVDIGAPGRTRVISSEVIS